nr:immunoglobulin heavy chain junction region [Macaca mulatta]MOX61946.1 immunoglobulin heavy chain junction region [Macaca mulatta]MOX62900.1 immunoglobulin heavy chain junction region [Macaca mulatta]MOX65428.1 immunoglobulin heavy chain junction region [Macaca mulatta]
CARELCSSSVCAGAFDYW